MSELKRSNRQESKALQPSKDLSKKTISRRLLGGGSAGTQLKNVGGQRTVWKKSSSRLLQFIVASETASAMPERSERLSAITCNV